MLVAFQAFPNGVGDALHDKILGVQRRQELPSQGFDRGQSDGEAADRALEDSAGQSAVAEMLVPMVEQVLKTE